MVTSELNNHWEKSGEKHGMTTQQGLPCLLSISDELFSAVVVVAVTAVYVAHRPRHFLHGHRALGVDLCLGQS